MKFLITENQLDRIVYDFLNNQHIVQSKKNPDRFLINGRTAFFANDEKLKYAYFMENILNGFLKGIWKEYMLLNWFNSNFGYNYKTISKSTEVSSDDFGIPDPNDPNDPNDFNNLDWDEVQSRVRDYMAYLNSVN